MKVLIIEDEAPAFRRLQKVLEEIGPEIDIIDVLDSVADSCKWLDNHQAPDLIFMDIQLSDGISFDIFEQTKVTSPVIFTTAFDEYTLRAFKVNSIDYLLKPIKKDELERSIEKYLGFQQAFQTQAPQKGEELGELLKKISLSEKQYKNRFLIKLGDKLLSIATEDIAYFHMRQGIVHLHANDNKSYLTDHSLDELSNLLDPEKFYRANRQYIISYDAIDTVHKYHKGKLLVELQQKVTEPIVVSMEKATSFKKWLDQ